MKIGHFLIAVLIAASVFGCANLDGKEGNGENPAPDAAPKERPASHRPEEAAPPPVACPGLVTDTVAKDFDAFKAETINLLEDPKVFSLLPEQRLRQLILLRLELADNKAYQAAYCAHAGMCECQERELEWARGSYGRAMLYAEIYQERFPENLKPRGTKTYRSDVADAYLRCLDELYPSGGAPQIP
ncbi:MAG: hypothetical protein NT003_04175 [Candidatus Magasanikbacteria bacterium]|nr:hypothetical protein [Candidatus Magasanikbacteria bacterium]